jgi:hypothetical protein
MKPAFDEFARALKRRAEAGAPSRSTGPEPIRST